MTTPAIEVIINGASARLHSLYRTEQSAREAIKKWLLQHGSDHLVWVDDLNAISVDNQTTVSVRFTRI
jgi:hypothetical protein